jgi:hypothetical protein
MANGGLWVLASTPLNTPTKAKLDELGPVECLTPFLKFGRKIQLTKYSSDILLAPTPFTICFSVRNIGGLRG